MLMLNDVVVVAGRRRGARSGCSLVVSGRLAAGGLTTSTSWRWLTALQCRRHRPATVYLAASGLWNDRVPL